MSFLLCEDVTWRGLLHILFALSHFWHFAGQACWLALIQSIPLFRSPIPLDSTYVEGESTPLSPYFFYFPRLSRGISLWFHTTGSAAATSYIWGNGVIFLFVCAVWPCLRLHIESPQLHLPKHFNVGMCILTSRMIFCDCLLEHHPWGPSGPMSQYKCLSWNFCTYEIVPKIQHIFKLRPNSLYCLFQDIHHYLLRFWNQCSIFLTVWKKRNKKKLKIKNKNKNISLIIIIIVYMTYCSN